MAEERRPLTWAPGHPTPRGRASTVLALEAREKVKIRVTARKKAALRAEMRPLENRWRGRKSPSGQEQNAATRQGKT